MLHLFSGILEEGGTREHSFGLVTPSRTFHLTAETDVDRRYIHVHTCIHLYVPKYVHVLIPIHVHVHVHIHCVNVKVSFLY